MGPLNQVMQEPGDRLVLDVDGMTEQENEHEVEFGEEWVFRLAFSRIVHLRADDAMEAITAAMIAHTGRKAHLDDMTLVIARVV